MWIRANKTQLMDPKMANTKTVTATIPIIELVPTTKIVTATVPVTQIQMVTVAVCLFTEELISGCADLCRPLSLLWQVPIEQAWSQH